MVQGSGGIWCGFASTVVTLASGKGHPWGLGTPRLGTEELSAEVCARSARRCVRGGGGRDVETEGGTGSWGSLVAAGGTLASGCERLSSDERHHLGPKV